MKRLLVIMMALFMVLSLAGCGSNTENSGSVSDRQEKETQQNESSSDVQSPAEEESVIFGNDTLGWLDLGAYKDYVRGTGNEADIMQVIARGSEGGLIQAETLTFSNEPDYAYVCDYLRSYYSRDTFTGKDYENKDEWEITLDGMPALKVYGERDDSRHEGGVLSCVGYITQNAAGDYIIYKLSAPKDLMDENGEVYRPTIQDLCDIVETTFRRTK